MENMQFIKLDDAFIDNLKEIIGVEKNETLEFIFPQFTRTDGIKVNSVPLFFEHLHNLSEDNLINIGCCKWDTDEENNIVHWLFPGEWYDYIPEGLKVVTINGVEKSFSKNICDNDIRFGCLSYGFKQYKGDNNEISNETI